MSEFDPYDQWLGIRPTEQPPSHYRLLGITQFESDPDVISSAAERQMSFVRQQGIGSHAGHAQKLLNELAAARLCLLSDERQQYEDGLRSVTAEPSAVALDAAADQSPPQIKVSRAELKSSAPAGSRWRRQRLPLMLGASGVFVVAVFAVVSAALRPSKAPQLAETTNPERGRIGLANVGAGAALVAPTVAEIDLLSNIDLQRDAVRGTWERSFDELRVVSEKPADLLEFRKPVPDEYELEFEAKTPAPATSVNFGLKVGACVVNVSLDSWGGRTSGMAMVDGRPGDGNETTWRDGPLFVPDRWSHVVCRVRKGSVLVQCDGKTIIDWKGSPTRLSTCERLRPASQEHLYLASWEHPIAFRALTLRPLTPVETVLPLPARETNTPGPIDDDFERTFAQRMLDRGATISIRGDGQALGGEIAQLPEWLFSVESVTLTSPRCLVEDTDIADAGRLPRLSGITINTERISDRGFSQFAKCEKLISLTLGPDSRISPDAVRSCQRLLTLRLDAHPQAVSLLAAAAALPSLTSVSVTELTAADLSVLRQFPRLQSLSIEKSTLTRDNLNSISQCPGLLGLNQTGVSFEFADGQPLDPGSKVRTLSFRSMPVPAGMLALLLDAAQQIDALHIQDCNMDSDAWKRLQSTGIRTLSVANTTFDDGNLQFLPATLKNLQLTRTAVTGSGFQDHTSGFPELQSLTVNLTPLTDEGIELLLHKAPNLTGALLMGTNLTPDAFRQLAELQFLGFIGLDSNQNADSCLLNLRPAPALRFIQGKFSDDAKREFLKARPDCKFR